MFISEETILKLADKFGQPHEVSFAYDTTEEECNRIKSSQRNGREHDVTMYIIKENKVVVIAKHFYPKGLYRAPSGGINVGEDFIDGAKREALEETGCQIDISKFLLKTHVQFKQINSTNVINWYSYVFQAEYLSGNFIFTDTNEIRELALVKLDEFKKYAQMMRASSIAGLHYRADLHDEVKKLLSL